MTSSRSNPLALLAGPLLLLALFGAGLLLSERLLDYAGVVGDGTERQKLGYILGIGFWLAAAQTTSRILHVLVWAPMSAGPAPAPRLLIDLITFGVYAGALTVIAGSVFGLSLTGFWATSSALGLVLGFALRNLILDLFTGIAVNVEQPFRAGDWLEIPSPDGRRVGRVVEMNWRTTRLATEDGDVVILPNGMLATLAISNRGATGQRMRGEVRVRLDFAIPSERARSILQAAAMQATGAPGFLSDPSPTVLVGSVGADGVEYLVRYWTTVWKDVSPSSAADVVLSAVVEHLRHAGLVPGHSKEDVFFAPRPPRQLDALSDEDRAELLSRVEVFRALRTDEIAELAADVHRVTVRAGDVLLQAGEPGESMFIMVEGVLDVLVANGDGPARKVSRIGPGEVFGEMSLLTGEPRSATIQAATDVVAYEVTRVPVSALFERRPEIASRISEVVAERLAERQVALAAGRKETVEAPGVIAGRLLSRIKAVFRLGRD